MLVVVMKMHIRDKWRKRKAMCAITIATAGQVIHGE
jgi:hypothetical protein